MKVYDASNKILGRFCSVIAKKLLEGEEIAVINAEKAVVSGKPDMVIRKYKEKVDRGDPIHGPFFPRYPDQILRRTVRGMIPWHKPRGREAFKRLKVYIGVPDELKGVEPEEVEGCDASKLQKKERFVKYVTLEEISLALGAKKRW